MWTTAALVAALSLPAAHADQLALTNIRSTYGLLGPVRPHDRLLPGDHLHVAFDIVGITVDRGGKVLYSMGTEVTNAKGATVFKQDPRDLTATNSLGGSRVPAVAHLNIGLDQAPGKYTLTVIVTDRASRQSQTFSRPFEVLPSAFGLIHVAMSGDPDGRVPAGCTVEGESVWVNFGGVGFARDKSKNPQPHVVVEMRVLDEAGQPTLDKPFRGEVKQDVPENMPVLPMKFLLSLNRPGKFTVELKATDMIDNKTAKLTFPLNVAKAN